MHAAGNECRSQSPSPNRIWRRGMLLIAVGGLLAAGCGQGEVRAVRPMEPVQERLLSLGNAYSRHISERGKPPKGPDDLSGFLAGDGPLTSQRDGKPFVFFWGIDLRTAPDWAKARPILANESEGMDGSRYVLTTMKHVELLDEEEFRASSMPPNDKGVK